tara:strand:+ start:192 stop:848 length:657 start_codon:yes stop_codon:yes gene_type:complete
MNIKSCNDVFPYIIIDNFYINEELNLIWNELDFLSDGDKFNSPEETGSATNDSGILKNNKGMWLDRLYKDRKYSNILTCSRKLIYELDFILSKSNSWWFKCLLGSKDILNIDHTLLSYYDEDDYYAPHFDRSILTSLTWLYKEPKGFDGGDFILNPTMYTDKKHFLNCMAPSKKIELKNNRVVMFPGMIPHLVTPVKMKNEVKGMGRFCISNFLNTFN